MQNLLVSGSLEYQRLRAPRADGGTLIDPSPDAVGELLHHNQGLAEQDYDLQGRSLTQLAAAARGQLARDAWAYTRGYCDVPSLPATVDRVLIAGHQPQLFHPGVWFKNFALDSLAGRYDAVAVNLIVDSDTCKSATVRVPGGSVDDPRAEAVPLDHWAPETPFEERAILDPECLASFGQRAGQRLQGMVPNPILPDFWPLVVERSRHEKNLGECLAQARRQQEGRWGVTTLELPQSHVCGSEAFRWFACHLLAHAERFRQCYNDSVAAYRRANKVRSTAHPAPDLAMDGEWIEAPFWIWRADKPRRQRLFMRPCGQRMHLSDRRGWEISLDLSAEGDARRAVGQLADLAAAGVKLRTRALATTMFARLVLGNVFMHGIGGAKYDQVTSLMIRQFFGLEPPGYMTVTATLRLPIAHDQVTADDARLVNQRLRELEFHPERHLPVDAEAIYAEIVQRKRDLIAADFTPDTARERCQAIRAANEQLQPAIARERQRLLTERESTARSLRAEAILGSRDYAFCLYPETLLRKLIEAARAE